MKEAHFEKRDFFKNIFHQARNTFLHNHAYNNMHFGVDPLRVLYVFRIFKIPCFFFDPREAAQTEKKGPLGMPILRIGPPSSSPPSRGAIRVLEPV